MTASGGEDQEFNAFPMMDAVDALVQAPEVELLSIDPKPYGKVTIGACYTPQGPMLTIGVHDRSGATLIGGMLPRQFLKFADLLERLGARIAAGEFDHPEQSS